jgi:signal transduction histidine kinase
MPELELDVRAPWRDMLEEGVARGTLDDAVMIAASICGTPNAHVNIVDDDRQWSAAKVGKDLPAVPRDQTFCAHAIRESGPMVVPDAQLDPRFADNPLVTGEPGIRFYAGTPLLGPDGERVGVLCVVDWVPRELSAAQSAALVALGRQVSSYWALVQDARCGHDGFVSLAEAEQMRHEFVDLVSHHLRTPLTSIRTFLELLSDGTEIEPQLAGQLVDVVRNNSDRLLRLVDNLFVMAAATQVDLLVGHGDVDLTVLAHRAASSVHAVAIKKGIRIGVQAPGPVHVTGDPERLAHALEHLAFNAVRFTDRGGQVQLRVQRDPLPVVEVSDTGIGIEPERQARLVDPLACLGTDTGDPVDNCIGLAAVNAVIYAHHGTLDLHSRLGRGTTFRLTLPVRAAAGSLARPGRVRSVGG